MNASEYQSFPRPPESAGLRTFHIFYLVVTTVAIIVGNALVIMVIRVDRRLHSPTFYFLGNLAVADLLVGIGYVPFYIVAVLKKAWILGAVWCRGHAFVVSTSYNASLMTLCVVSVDRFLDISDPLRYYGRMTKKKTRLLIAFIWIHAVFWATGPLWNWGETVLDQSTNTCRPNFGAKTVSGKVYAICLATFAFAFPVLITIYTYFKIFRVADDQSKKIAKDSTTSRTSIGSDEHSKPTRDRKAYKTVLVIIGTFVICWLPYTIGTSIKILTGNKEAPYWLSYLGLTLALTNSCVNPVIYTIRDRRFRRGIKKFLRSRSRILRESKYLSRSGATPSNLVGLGAGIEATSPRVTDRIRLTSFLN
ncbi:Alpha-1A adrenergic receptor [Exaiptasia diaphana]|nr:Alpha-1A adrenergic receptor [Exaiptasia diaphana]